VAKELKVAVSKAVSGKSRSFQSQLVAGRTVATLVGDIWDRIERDDHDHDHDDSTPSSAFKYGWRDAAPGLVLLWLSHG